jgi:hypothetical protein
MIFGSIRSAEALPLPDFSNFFLGVVAGKLFREAIWPRLSEAMRGATVHSMIWLSFKITRLWLMHSKSDREAFLEFFEELKALNREAAVDKNLLGYPT